nr:hypothetical protein [Tanacetum cinerariifolium]
LLELRLGQQQVGFAQAHHRDVFDGAKAEGVGGVKLVPLRGVGRDVVDGVRAREASYALTESGWH